MKLLGKDRYSGCLQDLKNLRKPYFWKWPYKALVLEIEPYKMKKSFFAKWQNFFCSATNLFCKAIFYFVKRQHFFVKWQKIFVKRQFFLSCDSIFLKSNKKFFCQATNFFFIKRQNFFCCSSHINASIMTLQSLRKPYFSKVQFCRHPVLIHIWLFIHTYISTIPPTPHIAN